MNTYISLNRNIDCNYICGQINKLLESVIKQNNESAENLIICISIKKSEEQYSPKLIENKQDQ